MSEGSDDRETKELEDEDEVLEDGMLCRCLHSQLAESFPPHTQNPWRCDAMVKRRALVTLGSEKVLVSILQGQDDERFLNQDKSIVVIICFHPYSGVLTILYILLSLLVHIDKLNIALHTLCLLCACNRKQTNNFPRYRT